jgi:ABC-2 type transport system permease protein
MSDARLVIHQVKYDLLALIRDPESRVFTLALPILFLFLFVSVLGIGDIRVEGKNVDQATYFVPHIAAFGVIGATMVNLLVYVVTQREMGILKRRRSTPVPAWVIIVGRTLTSVITAFVIVAVLLLVGWLVYDVTVPASAWPAVAVTIALGSMVFCALAFAISTFVGSLEAALPVAQFVSLPIYFISGIFFPADSMPDWVLDIAEVFPMRPLATALLEGFNPNTVGAAFDWGALAVMLAWGVGALIVATVRFSWSPKGT